MNRGERVGTGAHRERRARLDVSKVTNENPPEGTRFYSHFTQAQYINLGRFSLIYRETRANGRTVNGTD